MPEDGKAMTAWQRMELLRWLIDRNDRLRSSYSSRALLVLTVNTFAVGVLVLLAERFRLGFSGLPLVVWAVIFAAAVVAGWSMYNAFRASVSFRKSRIAFPSGAKNRIFVHPDETFHEFKTYDAFASGLADKEVEELTERWSGELWVVLNQQSGRYAHLRLAVRLMLIVLLLAIAAFALAVVSAAVAAAG